MKTALHENPFAGFYYTSNQLREFGFKSVGKNVAIHSRASIYCPENIELADNIRIDDYSVIIASGPLKIGSYISIPNFCFIGSRSGITLQDFSTLAPGVKLFSASDDYSGNFLTNVTVPSEMTGCFSAPIEIGKHVIIGTNSVILPGVKIGDGCAIGAFSMVKESLEPWGVYAGIPVKRLYERMNKVLYFESKIHNINIMKMDENS